MQPYGNWQWFISLLLGASIITGIIYLEAFIVIIIM